MTSTYERRIRRLEAKAPAFRRSVVFFGLPGQPDPDPTCIGLTDIVVRISFVGSCDGGHVEEGEYARH